MLKRNHFSLLTLVTILAFSITQSYGQGCSDAGFCTMGAMKPSQIYTKKINFKLRSAEVSWGHAKTTLSPVIDAITADLTFGINEKTSFQVKLPYYRVSGSLGETSGLSDISYSITRNVYSTEQFHINATIGGKIPTNKSDLDSDIKSESFKTPSLPAGTSIDLPMYYQTSLGSYDLVAGASYISQKWMFATGIQIALTENENDFRWGQWGGYPTQSYILDYPLANKLKRGTDVMLRVERAFHFSKWDIRVGMLPIYRITKDEIYNFNTDQRVKVDKTTGLAMTALLNVAYHFNTNNSISVLYGHKLTDREINPDGLTRKFVTSIGYVIRF